MIKVLSFGAGVQSTALLLMSCKGILPKLDYCVFADVGWEPESVYSHLEWCKDEASKAGIEIHVVKQTEGGLRADVIKNMTSKDGNRFASMPFFVRHDSGDVALSLRQCTNDYKITPLSRFMRREILGLKPRQRAPKNAVIECWLGISFDEAPRAKPSRDKWKVHIFPFLNWGCDYLKGKMWRRYQIIKWLETNYPDHKVPRSACIGCPFRDNKSWREIKANPEEWKDAVEFDRLIRSDKRGKIKQDMYLHRKCIPLDQIDLRTDEEKGQNNLWDNECEGMCGL